MTWRELLAMAVEKLSQAGIGEAQIDAWQLFSESFSMSRAMYFLKRDEVIPGSDCLCAGDLFTEDMRSMEIETKNAWMKGEIEGFVRCIKLRSERIPLQQITRHQEFMGLDFWVNEHVLIPRQDTEILVETVLEDLKRRQSEWDMTNRPEGERKTLGILDMCAGSGCIGISLERLLPVPVKVLGADISEDALKVAKENGDQLGCERYRVIKSDLFEKIEGMFDIIVSNPPYIPTEVIETLNREVKDHEPRLALDGEADGLAFYRRIAVGAPKYLVTGGKIYLEIGYDQGDAVSALLYNAGFDDVKVIRDLAGLDRVVAAVWPGLDADDKLIGGERCLTV